MDNQIRTRLLVPHKRDCLAVQVVKQGRWQTPFGSVANYKEYRSANGANRGRTYAWLIILCNDPNCPAQLAAREDTVVLAATYSLK